MTWLALAFTAGLAASLALPEPPFGSFLTLLLPCLAAPMLAWSRPPNGGGSARLEPGPATLVATLVVVSAGSLAGGLSRRHERGTCFGLVPPNGRVAVEGVLESLPAPGTRTTGLLVIDGLGNCRGPVQVVMPRTAVRTTPGRPVSVVGVWDTDPRRSGDARYRIFADSIGPSAVRLPARARLLAQRAHAQAALRTLFPSAWELAEALVLARKEALAPDVREDFARTGLAHLLAISGFHVGVVAGLLTTAFNTAGLGRRRTAALAASGVWTYVIAIGMPDAAARAATLLTFAALARVRARPAHRVGALSAAWVSMLALDPGALTRIGFQLSFAGALGLAALAPQAASWLERRVPRTPRALRLPLAAGAAATVATLPLVAWHFERVSLIGIPATLIFAPAVALAIPGIGTALLLAPLAPAAAGFLAGGVEWVLLAIVRGVEVAASVPLATAAVPRTWVLAGTAGALLTGATAVRWIGAKGRGRRILLLSGAVSAVIAWPLVARSAGAGRLELIVLDVGQGDAIAIRSPRGRWLLVDAGPRSDTWDAGERVIVPYLRRRGAGRLEGLVLTHPDLDHVGGAPAVLTSLEVGRVFDPGLAAGRSPFVATLEAAGERGVPWLPLRAGARLELDGIVLRAIHPLDPPTTSGNDASVVLLVRFRGFTALLTGDAEQPAERSMLERGAVEDVDLLKVGHHGSATSTIVAFLERSDPEIALIPVGRRNRYGHPSPVVLERLSSLGVRTYRTDTHGALRVIVDGSGAIRVETER